MDAGIGEASFGPSSCADGLDNDNNGLTDCADPNCKDQTCRGATDTCDLAEVCTSGACPSDALKAASVVCRASAGDCDVEERCTGGNAACPTDALKSATSLCRGVAGLCDAEELCTGTSPTCPADVVRSVGSVCRAAFGTCDVAEVCSGAAVSCPPDGFKSSATVCRASAGSCDLEEKCTGAAALCPADARTPTGTLCRAVAGSCDVAEVCSGAVACPVDQFVSAGTSCRAAVGPCDAPEACGGSGALCPVDALQLSSYLCRGATCSSGQSIPDLYCGGATTQCPVPASTTCGGGAYLCQDGASCYSGCSSAGGGAGVCGSGYFCNGSVCTGLLSAQSVCTSGFECAAGVCTTFWRDADQDLYTAAATSFCGTTPPGSGWRAAQNGNDCDDDDSRVHPGQVAYFTSPRFGAGSYDFNCNGADEKENTKVGTTCGLVADGCGSDADGWLALPACGASGQILHCVKSGSVCVKNQIARVQGCQ